MKDAEEFLHKLDISTLVNEIHKIIPLDKSQLAVEVEKYIWPRLDFMHGENSNDSERYFILEESYVETEWKDMISVHYINTSYEVQNTVVRIHIFLAKEMSERVYGGFFTLRKIDEPRIMLSYIYPNWSVIVYDDDKLFNVMTYKKKVHILGKEFTYSTYPLFVQDNNTISCAEASMISMSQYLHHKFDYNKIRILNLGKAYSSGKTKLYPSSGLRPTQMIEILNYYNISIEYHVFIKDTEAAYEEFREYIDCSIESGLPVILGLSVSEEGKKDKLHTVQIIGHTKQNRNYVVYDDSGYFLKNGLDYNGFVLGVGWEDIKEFIKPKNSFMIYPVHEKVYIPYEIFKDKFLNAFNGSDSLKKMKEKYIDLSGVRYFLADNREVKKFLQKDMQGETETEAIVLEEEKRLLEMDMTHYLWVCEIPVKNISVETEYLFFFANPTYSRVTTKNIFINKIPILRKEQLGLLYY